MNEKLIKLGSIVLCVFNALGESLLVVKKMTVVRQWHVFILKFVLHSKTSIYWPLKLGFPWTFLVCLVLVRLSRQFMVPNITFSTSENEFRMKYLSILCSHSKIIEDLNDQNNPVDHQKLVHPIGRLSSISHSSMVWTYHIFLHVCCGFRGAFLCYPTYY